MVQILDVMQKCLEGLPLSENDYQLRRFAPKVREKIKEHDIKFDPSNPVPSDDSMADEVFQAGFELLLEVGAYCIDSQRVISYTEQEIKEGLRNAPSVLHMGEGRDRRKFTPRKIGDKNPPWCLLGAGGQQISDEKSFLTLMEGYAEIPETDAITTPAFTKVGGMRIRPKSPLEVLGAMRAAVLAREATNRAGRQGIPFMNTLSTAESDTSLAGAMHPRYGLRPTDGYMIASLDPMKVDFRILNKVTTCLSLGCPVGMDWSPLMGGYSGGPEGTAIVTVAGHLMGALTLQTSYLIPFPLHLKYVSNSSREMLWVISTMAQAISRNTHLLSLSLNYTSAGPCTTMALQENSASVTAAVASGLSIESCGTASNKYEDRSSPVEPRIAGEVAHSVAGMKRSDANEIVKGLLKKYESKLPNPPLGKTVHECWDSEKRRPSKEFSSLVRSFKRELAELGVELRPEPT